MSEAYQGHAERLADLLLEQLERLTGSEHEEAYILTLATRDLIRRVTELGEVIESESRDLDDRAALQMATALQAQCASVLKILGQIADDPRFGLLPDAAPGAISPWGAGRAGNGHLPDDGPRTTDRRRRSTDGGR